MHTTQVAARYITQASTLPSSSLRLPSLPPSLLLPGQLRWVGALGTGVCGVAPLDVPLWVNEAWTPGQE